MIIAFYRDHIEFDTYLFSVASVGTNSKVKAENIRAVWIQPFQCSIITHDGEILFIPLALESHIKLFAKLNNISELHTIDVWGYLLEPFLDTVHSTDDEDHSIRILNTCGFTNDDIKHIRAKVRDKVLTYNAMAWEWVHLGHWDLLAAFGLANKPESKISDADREFYNWTHEIALRGLDQTRATPSRQDRITSSLDHFIQQLKSIASSDITEKPYELIKRTIETRYSEASRHYHTLEHAYSVVELSQNGVIDEKDRLLLAIAGWFHDLIYDPAQTDNEAQSAQMMRELLQPLGVSQELIEQAKQLILITKDHLSAENDLEKIIADADMAIFAQPVEIHEEYAANVRQEYAIVPDEFFYPARLAFLEKLLNHIRSTGKLYHTFHPMHESMALENIQREIMSIRKRED